jgi:hypothetical protein
MQACGGEKRKGRVISSFHPCTESLTHVSVMWHAYVDSQVG